MKIKGWKCEHCGEVFDVDPGISNPTTPTHDWPAPCRQVCPGARRAMIPASSRRVLGKDRRVSARSPTRR